MKEAPEFFSADDPPRLNTRFILKPVRGDGGAYSLNVGVIPMINDQGEDPDFPPQAYLGEQVYSRNKLRRIYIGFFLLAIGAGYVVLSTVDYSECSRSSYGCTWQ